MTKFKTIRRKAKEFWFEKSRRRRKVNDNISDTLFCDWQIELVPKDSHNSLFCSIGEWCTNLTDLLCDYRFDHYVLENSVHAEALFRYYTKILLVVSEILTDIQDLLIYIKNLTINDKNAVRQLMTNQKLNFTISELFEYINSICKHKIGKDPEPFKEKLHLCNHHSTLVFEDSKNYKTEKGNLKISGIIRILVQPKAPIEIPRIKDIIECVLYSLEVLNTELREMEKTNISLLRQKLEPFEIKI